MKINQRIKLVFSALAIILIAGCAETPQEYIALKGKDADDYELDSEDFSETSRFLYAASWAKPKRYDNNLERYYVTPSSNTAQTAGQVASVGLNMLGLLSNFDAGAAFLVSSNSKTSYDPILGMQRLYTIKKFDTNRDWDTQARYINALGTQTALKALGEGAVAELHENPDTLLLSGTEIKEPSYHFCQTGQVGMCRAFTHRIPLLISENENYIPMIPQGDVIIAQTYLPPGFPIDKLQLVEAEGVEQYLYVPPMKLSGATGLWKEENLTYISEWYKQGLLSLNPYLKRLSDGEIMYFNPKVTALQSNSKSLYRVLNPENSTETHLRD